jgi:hypothetical protein
MAMKTITASAGALVVSLIVLGLFGAVVAHAVPAPNETVATLLNNAVVLVLGYWIGSSHSSQAKDDTIATAIQATPPPEKP